MNKNISKKSYASLVGSFFSKMSKCDSFLNELMTKRHPTITQLTQSLHSKDCDVHLKCRPCKKLDSKAFYRVHKDGSRHILLCSEKMINYYDVVESITHELVHAYDDCVGRIDSLDHIACSEIRAYFHSDCKDRGFTRAQTWECVRKHSIDSILLNKNTKREQVEEMVDKKMSSCMNKPLIYL